MSDKAPLTKHCHSRSVSQEVYTSELYPNLTFCGYFFLVSYTILFSNWRKAQLLVHVCSWFWQLPLRHIMRTHAHPLRCLSEEISYFNLYLPLASHAHPFFFSFQYLITNAWLPVTFLSVLRLGRANTPCPHNELIPFSLWLQTMPIFLIWLIRIFSWHSYSLCKLLTTQLEAN